MRTLVFIIILAFVCNFTIAQNKDELMGFADVSDSSEWVRKGEVILKKEVFEAFDKMSADAAKEGVMLRIIVGYRTFKTQKITWDYKWNESNRSHLSKKERVLNIMNYFAMPSTSRHHWGTDIDLNSTKLAYYETDYGKKIYSWLCKNAHKYGFYQPYTAGRSKGYKEEKWHWSYYPIASTYEQQFLSLVTNSDITGFSGSEMTEEIDVINNWVRLK